jgi:hypothetical protein
MKKALVLALSMFVMFAVAISVGCKKASPTSVDTNATATAQANANATATAQANANATATAVAAMPLNTNWFTANNTNWNTSDNESVTPPADGTLAWNANVAGNGTKRGVVSCTGMYFTGTAAGLKDRAEIQYTMPWDNGTSAFSFFDSTGKTIDVWVYIPASLINVANPYYIIAFVQDINWKWIPQDPQTITTAGWYHETWAINAGTTGGDLTHTIRYGIQIGKTADTAPDATGVTIYLENFSIN